MLVKPIYPYSIRKELTFPQQTEEHNLQAAKRRAEREAVDYKQRVLRSV
jgi:hypothetical protein